MMVIKDYVLDEELSMEMFERHRSVLNQGACYNNVFNLCGEYELVRLGVMRVAYGYWTAIPGIMARHCFFVTDDKKIIDPTYAFRSNKENVEYWIFAVLEFRDYLDKIRDENLDPALHYTLREPDHKLIQESFQEGIMLIN
jgi:hypothetical protein